MFSIFKDIFPCGDPCVRVPAIVGYYDTEMMVHWTEKLDLLLTYKDNEIWCHSTFPFNYCWKLDGRQGFVDRRHCYALGDNLFLHIQYEQEEILNIEGLKL